MKDALEKLGKYEVLGTIGRGGMGVVYSARDRQLDRLVALKVISDELGARGDHRERLLREARAIAALHHPNVATIFELGETEVAGEHLPRLFLAMEHIQGEDLEVRLRQGRMTAEQAIEITLQLLAGLDAAHSAGVIHRDLKPGNIRVTPRGVVKILDFGLAKMELAPTIVQQPGPTGGGTPSPRSDRRSQLDVEGPLAFHTEEAMVMGTVPYLAPEQARGRPVDARADLFSVGVILYRMLSGELPFRARTFVDFVLEMERERPAPMPGPAADEELHHYVSELMARNPRDRPDSAAAARSALEEIRDRRAQRLKEANDEPLPQPRRRRLAIIGLTLVALLAVVVAFAYQSSFWGRRLSSPSLSAESATARSTLRLAVLPFANRTGDPALEHVCQGLAYSLSSLMFSIRELEVVDQSISAGYSPSSESLEALATAYGINRVITGQVLMSQGQVQIQVNLVDPAGGQILDSETYTGPLADLLDVQASIARGLGNSLRDSLSPESRRRFERRATSSSQAYEDRLRALQYLEAPDVEDLDVAIFYLRRAVAEDSTFSAAHADLAWALLLRYQANRDPDSIRDAIASAEIAVDLDPQLVRAQMTLGRAYNEAGRSKDAAERFRAARALKLEGVQLLSTEEERLADQQPGPAPNEQVDQVEALLQLARALQDAGDVEGAAQTLAEAITESPADWRPHHDLGLLYLRTGRLELARQTLSEADRLAPPGETSPAMNLVVVTLYEGDYRGAVTAYENLTGQTVDPLLASNIGTAYYNLGDLERAEEFYRLAIKLQPGNEGLRGNLGDLLLKRGEADLARSAYSVALSLLDEQLAVFPDKPILKTYKALYLAKAGRCDEALPIALRSENTASGSVEGPYLLARALALCDLPQEAIPLLAQARALGVPRQMVLDEADFEKLRAQPAFRALLDEVE